MDLSRMMKDLEARTVAKRQLKNMPTQGKMAKRGM